MRQRSGEDLAVPVPARLRAVLIELAGRCAADHGPAARPDAVAHVRVGGVADAGLPEIAQVLLVFLDLLVAAGEVERDLGHVVDARVADVPDRDARVRVALLDLHEALGGAQVRRRADAHILGAELLEEQQLLVGGVRRGLHAQLDAGRGRLLRVQRTTGQCSAERATRHPSKVSPVDLRVTRAASCHGMAPVNTSQDGYRSTRDSAPTLIINDGL